MKKIKGFTLVEVVVSLLIISIIAAIFLPALTDIFKQTANLEDNDISFTNAYNLTREEIGKDTETSSNADVTCKVYNKADATTPSLTLYDSTGAKQAEYTPEKVILYYSPYSVGRFGKASNLMFNDYLVK